MVGAAIGRFKMPAKETAIMARKHYSVEFQEEACKLVSEQHQSPKEAAQSLGITRTTLDGWLRKRGLLKPVELVEPDYAASDDPRLLKGRIKELEKRLKRAEIEKEILKKAKGRGLALSQPGSRARACEVPVDP